MVAGRPDRAGDLADDRRPPTDPSPRTGEDMARFVRYLMVEGAERHGPDVHDPSRRREAFGYGYGLFRLERGGRDYVGHGGGMVGYQAGLQWDPETGIGAVVLQSG